MALATTYIGWLSLIKEWLNVEEISDTQISYSLTLAQNELNKILDSWRMEGSSNLTASTDGQPIAMSGIADFNRIQLVIGGTYNQPLAAASFNELVNMAAMSNAGAPRPATYTHYAIQALSFHTYPAPKAGDVFKVYYYKMVPPLSVSLQSNIFSQYHEEALLYASLVAASQFIAEDERTMAWAALAKQSVDSINLASKSSKMGSTPLVREVSVYGTNNSYLG